MNLPMSHIPPARTTRSIHILMGASVLTLLLSIPLIVVGLWLALRHHIDCLKFLEGPIIFIGLALFLSSIVGFIGARRQRTMLLWIYVVLVFILLLLLFCFTLFAFIVISGGGGHPIQNKVFEEYRLRDYSQWFQEQVRDPFKWMDLKSCIQDRDVCASLDRSYPTLLNFNNAELSPLESGCCKPPTACGFIFANPTQWVNTTPNPSIDDCARWDNSPSNLCYNCDSCKAGLLETVKHDWSIVAVVCLIVLILLVLLYFVTWVVFVRGLWDGSFRRPHSHGFSHTTYGG